MRVGRRSARSSARAPLPAGFWPIWTTVALDLVGFGIVVPILGIYAERFGASPATVGLLFASFSAAQFVCAPLLGRLSDRIGRKPVIIVSLFGTAIGSLLTGLAPALWVVFLGRIVDGASGASVSVAQGAVTDLAPPDQRPRLLGLLGAAFGVGFVLGPAIGGLASLGGPRLPFFLAAGVALVNAFVALVRVPETLPRLVMGAEDAPAPAAAVAAVASGAGDGDGDGGLTDARRRTSLATYAVVMFLATAAFGGFEATFALLGQERFGWQEGAVAVVFVAIGIALVIVQAGLIGPAVERFGDLRVLRTALVLNAVGLVLLAAATSWPLLVPALALLVLGQGMATPTINALVADRARRGQRGQALGVQQSAGALARIVGPIVAGVLFQQVGIPAPYLVGAAGMGLACAALMRERDLPAERRMTQLA